ncbi:MAG: porin family protein, partial [Pseudolabrys sp.]
MKKSIGFIAVVAAFCLVSSANAADLPIKASSAKAAPTPWTGLYVNGGFGYGAWVADQTVFFRGACITCITQRQGGKGWLGTIGGGYDYQFTRRIVGGVFGDFQFSNLEGTIQDGQPFLAGQLKETSSWAVGVRAGWLLNDRTLTYVNGGLTGARFSGATFLISTLGTPAGIATNA